ncbi:hypothetical protein GCM10022200_10270 [Microbacterium awajiense]|uniref:Beta-lactamase-related domain-containing protein n=1 Tax=Microbacterium awajiense TaxID=415214 RepID=A0ABP7ACH2_9MICO
MTDHATPTAERTERLTDQLRRVVARADRARGKRDLPSAQVLVTAPGFEFASGDRARRFHSASVGKLVTAIRAMQLAETGALDLDAPVTELLPGAEWRGLFVVDGRDRAREATPWHLLTHTSGVADYFEGRADTGIPFEREIADHPDRRWSPDDLLDYTRRHQRPVGVPGGRFSYSDTGYVLLARILEEAGGASLGEQFHRDVFAPTGMTESALLFHTLPGGAPSTSATPAADLDIAPLWIGRAELSRATSLSCDWGGGGVVTTLDDLDRLLAAWGAGRLVPASVRDRMIAGNGRFRPGIRYGAGAMTVRYGGLSPFLFGMPHAHGHLGVTAAHAFRVPQAGVNVVLNLHSTREMVRSFRLHIDLVRKTVAALR